MRRARSNSLRTSSRVRSVTARKSRLAMNSLGASQNDRLWLLILRGRESWNKRLAGRSVHRLGAARKRRGAMKRREFVNGAAGIVIGGIPLGIAAGQQPLPSTIAGVRIVDSEIATTATALARGASPPYLFNHAVRTFLLGSLIGRALGLKWDDEVLYLASSVGMLFQETFRRAFEASK